MVVLLGNRPNGDVEAIAFAVGKEGDVGYVDVESVAPVKRCRDPEVLAFLGLVNDVVGVFIQNGKAQQVVWK